MSKRRGEVQEVQQRNKNPQAQNLETLEGIFAWKTKDPFFFYFLSLAGNFLGLSKRDSKCA
jgi:hypothetical protein